MVRIGLRPSIRAQRPCVGGLRGCPGRWEGVFVSVAALPVVSWLCAIPYRKSERSRPEAKQSTRKPAPGKALAGAGLPSAVIRGRRLLPSLQAEKSFAQPRPDRTNHEAFRSCRSSALNRHDTAYQNSVHWGSPGVRRGRLVMERQDCRLAAESWNLRSKGTPLWRRCRSATGYWTPCR